MSEWVEFTEDWPTWADSGRHIEIVTNDMSYIGELVIDDFGFDGEDEYPIFSVQMQDGNIVDFSSHERYRFIDE